MIVKSVLALAEAGLLHRVGDAAVQLIDDYLTNGADNSIFSEPEFQKTRDLNAFLKSEKLGKSDDFYPNLRATLALFRKMLRKSSEAKDINAAILAACA
ncbi:hypothetical protein [Agrobacterium rosae]|uniref:hypothetical protein n=1 Tax=Agrobacterium rosae TaxID=1972867 RepID=UPI000CD91AE4|nr:hypothetical protein [Agrobacterium rosae]POO56715.1 hypothetical protein CTT39_08535 [Agrobacterium rosae]